MVLIDVYAYPCWSMLFMFSFTSRLFFAMSYVLNYYTNDTTCMCPRCYDSFSVFFPSSCSVCFSMHDYAAMSYNYNYLLASYEVFKM
ncbi:uncharacterized protein BO87DRAFT_68283 [Aspergillus neoniger CBS 115656]|uniref:Uncharacterized protein n=1 Tax=Aspergillus neoniger (strain CBS 115656) TaxID=1448310 RepID=A0A318YGU0_ASPNB|nr:hypothetical protein BO87DRAFT_68283 [Aspergillus neoniger CBS 115656]PYH33419.1 hypothetical protein BO87DRAFT_68283 [Aspergillus neoniger CBS 115656]